MKQAPSKASSTTSGNSRNQSFARNLASDPVAPEFGGTAPSHASISRGRAVHTTPFPNTKFASVRFRRACAGGSDEKQEHAVACGAWASGLLGPIRGPQHVRDVMDGEIVAQRADPLVEGGLIAAEQARRSPHPHPSAAGVE